MKKYIDHINKLKEYKAPFPIQRLSLSKVRMDKFKIPKNQDALSKFFGDELRRTTLIDRQIKVNNESGKCEGDEYTPLHLIIPSLERTIEFISDELNKEFEDSDFEDEVIPSFIVFLRENLESKSKISEEKYLEWLKSELDEVEEKTEINVELVKKLASLSDDVCLEVINHKAIMGGLDKDDIAEIAFEYISDNASTISFESFEKLMGHISCERFSPMDYIVTHYEEYFEDSVLSSIAENPHFEKYSSNPRKVFELISESLDCSSYDSGHASASGASSPEHIEEDEDSIEVSENPATTSEPHIVGDQESIQAEQINAAKLLVNRTNPSAEDEDSIEVSENPAATSEPHIVGDQESIQAEQINAAKLLVNRTNPSVDPLKRSCPSYIEDDDDTPPAKRSCDESTYNLDEIIDVVSPNAQDAAQAAAIDASVHQSSLVAPTTYIGGEVENFWD